MRSLATAVAQAARRVVPRRVSVRRWVGPALLVLSALPAGCESGGDVGRTPNDSSAGETVRCEVERGPVKFTVEISPARPQLSDQPQLTLTIRVEQGVRVEKPPFGEAVGDFLIRDFHEPMSEVDQTTDVIRQIYTLEPTRAGKLTIAPIAVRFYDERDQGDGSPHTIESEALTVEVSTMLGDKAPTLADLRPLADPVGLPTSGWFSWIGFLGIVGGLAAAGAAVWRARSRPVVSEPQLSPQELAWLELEQMVQRKLAESDVKAFYVELTGVVRRYIERSTGVQAPEQTTEEFLREIVDEAVFIDEDRQRLCDFLESADLVKFAALQPDASDIEASFERAKEFIRLKRGAETEVAT